MSILLDIQLQSDRSVLSPVSSTWRYGFAVLAVLAALGVRLVLFPLLGDHAPYLPFILAVMVSARFGGRWPGVAATLASALGVAWFALAPKRSFAVADPHEMASLALFVAVALLVSLMVGQLRESLRSSIQAQLALQRETELIDLSHDAIVATDPGRRILRWNAGAAEMYGAPE